MLFYCKLVLKFIRCRDNKFNVGLNGKCILICFLTENTASITW